MEYYDTLLERMLSYYQGQTGCAPDDASDVMIRMKVLASQLDTLCKQTEEAARQAFPATATGEYLDRHAAMRGLARKEGTKAVAMVSFWRTTPAGYNITIPAGTVVQSGGPEALRYVTIRDAILLGSLRNVSAMVEAVEPGSKYNLKFGSITVMVTPPAGINSVTHDSPCLNGTDAESDESLRQRLLDVTLTPVIGGSPGYYRAMMLAESGVGKVKVLPAYRGGGTVDVVVYGSSGELDQSRLSQLQRVFSEQRDLGVDVAVRQAITTPVNLELELAVKEGWEYDAVRQSCQSALMAEMNRLDIGEPWLLARMNRVVMDQPGAYNCKIRLPADDAYPLEDRLLVMGGVTVTPMEVMV